MIQFDKTADATARTKKLCRDKGVPAWTVYSRWLPETSQFRSRICLPRDHSDDDRARLVAVLTEAGYGSVAVEDDPLRTVTAYSALTGTSSDPTAELARRALVEQLPESYSADEVSAMDDNEAIAMAVGAGVLPDQS